MKCLSSILLTTSLLSTQVLLYPLTAQALELSENASDQAILKQLEEESSVLELEIEQIKSELSLLKSGSKMYWGYSSNGTDMTWKAAWGFILPVIPQLSIIADEKAPDWLRWSSGIQLVSFGIASLGLAKNFLTPSQLTSMSFINQIDPQLATSLAIGGLSSYAAFGLVPSTVVSIRDGVVRQDVSDKLANLTPKLKKAENTQSQTQELIQIYQAVNNNQYEKALAKVELLPTDLAKLGQITSQRVDSWKKQKVNVHYQAFLEQVQNQYLELALDTLKTLIDDPLLSADIKTDLTRRRPELEKQIKEKQTALENKQRSIALAEQRREIYTEALTLAQDKDYNAALEKLDEYDWQKSDPEFAEVEERKKVWLHILYSQVFREAFDLANSNDFSGAVTLLHEYKEDWPKDHPDFNRMNTKYKEWRNILVKRFSIQEKYGFMGAEQIQILKNSGYRIIVSGDIPSNNYWSTWAKSWASHSYYIYYYDTKTLKSFAIIGGKNCGFLSKETKSYVSSKAKEYASNPQLGNIGIISIPYADAYVSTNLGSGKTCYTAVTPANLESWMIEGSSDDNLSNLKRLTKDEFRRVLELLRFLP